MRQPRYRGRIDPDLESVIEAFAATPGATVLAFVLGALFGSFANVCIARLPRDMSIVRPGSHCFACGAPVRWFDNLPIVSYLWLRGRCRRCGAGFSARYLLVEAATGLLFAATWHLALFALYPDDPLPLRLARFAVYAFFVFVLVVITFIDLDHKLILDKVTFPAIACFYGFSLLLRDQAWWEGLVGIAVGYGLVRAISDGYWYLTGREGMGYGDGKLLAVIGALLGWRAVAVSLFGGALAGSVIGVAAIAWARRRSPAAPSAATPEARAPHDPLAGDAATPVDDANADVDVPLRHVELPFGPFLVIGAFAYLFLQQQIDVQLALLWAPPP